jgi:electron transport complex protein RnfE
MDKTSSLRNSLMLAPLIGATGSWMTALGVWLVFMVVTLSFGLSMNAVRARLMPATHLVAGVLLAATLTGCAEIAARAWSLQWHQHLGIYSGLIALQCVILDHSGFFQSNWRDRLRLCVLFGALMVGLGLLREILGTSGIRLATLAPGGLILLGLLIAAWQAFARPTSSH